MAETLKKGSKGGAVLELQNSLVAAGYPVGTVDGIFGGMTDTAVRAFQADKGLKADGVVGPMTWAALAASGGGGSGGGNGGSTVPASKRSALVEAAKKQAKGGGDEMQAQMAAMLPSGTTLDEWFGAIVPDATFLGLPIRASDGAVPGIHEALLARLRLAEDNLRQRPQFSGRSDDQIRVALAIRDIGGLRRPKLATKGNDPSRHSFGLAIDVNPGTNPFVGNKKGTTPEFQENSSPRIIKRAMWLLRGETFDILTKLPGSALTVYRTHQTASKTLATYLRLADDIEGNELAELVNVARQRGDPHDLAWWRKRITDDRNLIKHYDFDKHPDPHVRGYMDMPEALIDALTDPKTGAGLLWGGEYRKAKDIMHFDWRGPGSVKSKA